MKKIIGVLLAIFWIGIPIAAEASPPDSKQLESDLQHLPWDKFRSVIESIPKLKMDVDQFGATGWMYVQATYKTYGWGKSIDKLDL